MKKTVHPLLILHSKASLCSQLMTSTPLHTREVPTVARFPAWPGLEASYRKGPDTSNTTYTRKSKEYKNLKRASTPL